MQAEVSKFKVARKYGLVIGNDAYETEQNQLSRSVADANAVATKLREIGFTISQHIDIKSEIMTVIREFSDKIEKDDLVVFYYSGHIYQFENELFLLPTGDSRIKEKFDVKVIGASLMSACERLKNIESNIVILILDGYTGYQIQGETQGLGHNGFASIPAKKRPTVMCAAMNEQSVMTITNKTEMNNTFTKALLKYLPEKNRSLLKVFDRIKRDVMQETQKKQSPTIIDGTQSTFIKSFILNPQESFSDPLIDKYNRWIRDIKFELEALTLKGPHSGGVYDKNTRNLIDYLRAKVHEFTLARNELIMEIYSNIPPT